MVKNSHERFVGSNWGSASERAKASGTGIEKYDEGEELDSYSLTDKQYKFLKDLNSSLGFKTYQVVFNSPQEFRDEIDRLKGLKSSQEIQPDAEISFGKYKGRGTYRKLYRTDPAYLRWMVRNVKKNWSQDLLDLFKGDD